jgi:hypothetical protein
MRDKQGKKKEKKKKKYNLSAKKDHNMSIITSEKMKS